MTVGRLVINNITRKLIKDSEAFEYSRNKKEVFRDKNLNKYRDHSGFEDYLKNLLAVWEPENQTKVRYFLTNFIHLSPEYAEMMRLTLGVDIRNRDTLNQMELLYPTYLDGLYQTNKKSFAEDLFLELMNRLKYTAELVIRYSKEGEDEEMDQMFRRAILIEFLCNLIIDQAENRGENNE